MKTRKKCETIIMCITIFLLMNPTSTFAFDECSSSFMSEYSTSKVNEVDSLLNLGISKDKVLELGSDIDLVSNLVATNDLTKIQINNLIEGLLKEPEQLDETYEVIYNSVNVNGDIIATNLIEPDTNETTLASTYSTNTGPHYVVTANAGYYKASGSITLPTVLLNDSSNQTAYAYGGIYTSTSGTDLGVFTKDGVKWKTFINMGKVNWSTSDAYSGWHEGGVDIYKSQHPTLYMVWKSDSNSVVVQVFDGSSYTLLSSISCYAPNRGFNTTGSGIKMKREHSLAYLSGAGDLTDGSYMINQSWSNVYIYNNSVTSRWTSAYTLSRAKGDTTDEKNCVTLSNVTQDYADTCTIRFNLS